MGIHTEQKYEETYQIPAKFGGFLFLAVKLKLGGRFRDSTKIIIMQEKSLEKNHVICELSMVHQIRHHAKSGAVFCLSANKCLLLCRGYSSVVEHPAAIRQVLGSNPSVPYFSKNNYPDFQKQLSLLLIMFPSLIIL